MLFDSDSAVEVVEHEAEVNDVSSDGGSVPAVMEVETIDLSSDSESGAKEEERMMHGEDAEDEHEGESLESEDGSSEESIDEPDTDLEGFIFYDSEMND